MASHDLVRLGSLVSPALLAELDRRYPERCGDPKAPHTDFIIAAAQRDLVNFLHHARAAAEEAAALPPLAASRSR